MAWPSDSSADDAEDALDETLERLVGEALADFPAEISRRIENVAIVIEDEPPPDRAMLACYIGVPAVRQNEWSWLYPHKIVVYRGPMLRHFGHDADLLAAEVRHVVRHEIAHYFGISDQRLVDIGRY